MLNEWQMRLLESVAVNEEMVDVKYFKDIETVVNKVQKMLRITNVKIGKTNVKRDHKAGYDDPAIHVKLDFETYNDNPKPGNPPEGKETIYFRITQKGSGKNMEFEIDETDSSYKRSSRAYKAKAKSLKTDFTYALEQTVIRLKKGIGESVSEARRTNPKDWFDEKLFKQAVKVISDLDKYGERNAAGLETILSRGSADRGQEDLHIEITIDHKSEMTNKEQHGRLFIIIKDNDWDLVAFESDKNWKLGKKMQQFPKSHMKKGVELSIKSAVLNSRSNFARTL